MAGPTEAEKEAQAEAEARERGRVLPVIGIPGEGFSGQEIINPFLRHRVQIFDIHGELLTFDRSSIDFRGPATDHEVKLTLPRLWIQKGRARQFARSCKENER